ncbi:MAG TPA: hypothetical protein VIU12_06385 [Chryseolinea sp.]
MKKNVTLDINHSEKKRVEYFLNSVNADLEQIPFDAQELSDANDIIAGFKFKEKGQPTFVIVIFATSYFQANGIGKANSFKGPNLNWTVNGDILFIVESTDERTSNQMLSVFAGKE